MIHLGFTGTRRGMTKEQLAYVSELVEWFVRNNDSVAAHHGDCIGADEQFHRITRAAGCNVVGHPSTHNLRAFLEFDFAHVPKVPLDRNADIVQAATVMLATPFEADEQQRGGTWSTIRVTRRFGKPLAIVKPDGSVERERWQPAITRTPAVELGEEES